MLACSLVGWLANCGFAGSRKLAKFCKSWWGGVALELAEFGDGGGWVVGLGDGGVGLGRGAGRQVDVEQEGLGV